jgi:hypothetical protein
MDAAERTLFADGVRHATGTGSREAVDAALGELGWRDALASDRADAVSVLFESLGAARATSSALDWLLADALGAGTDGAANAVLLPRLRETGAPGRGARDRCVVHGLGTAALGAADRVLVVTEDGAGASAVAVQVETRVLRCRPVQGLDPDLGLVEVTGEGPEGSLPSVRSEAAERVERAAPVDWTAALALGQLALGHELLGAGRAMLELAQVHARERIQFGRPIGTFQAVRHRLADSLVALEAAAALLGAAWDDPSPVTAAMAKSFTGRSVRTVSRHCQQVLAGIGFTTEHPLHLYVRRTLVLDQLLGAGRVLSDRLGADVLRTGTLPPAWAL